MNRTTCLLDKERGSCWMCACELGQGLIFAENEKHRFKIATSFGSSGSDAAASDSFPCRPASIKWTSSPEPGPHLAHGQRKTPSGTIVETEGHTVDPRTVSRRSVQ